MPKSITLYHGSDHIIPQPSLGKGKITNDYGQGFYCTAYYPLACEWAAKNDNTSSYVNEYQLDLTDLKVLDLSAPSYNTLHWITLLLENRSFPATSPLSLQAKEYLMEHFHLDVSKYDVIRGYRADDSYFSFAKDFINNTISVQHLAHAMKLGKLGIQYMLRTDKAFSHLQYVGTQEVDTITYHAKYLQRDLKARNDYNNSRTGMILHPDELYILDIIRGGVNDGDPRL